VKTRLVNIFHPLKHLGNSTRFFITKMAIDYSLVESAKANLLNSCDIDMILNLPCILPMLKFVNVLSNFV
jgi:hypothetical protein